MKPTLPVMLLAAVALSACGATMSGDAGVTRAESGVSGLLGATTRSQAQQPVLNRDYTVTGVEVTVPRSLTVSERNGIKPRADILWQAEPLGDRYAQVDAILTEALTQGTAEMHGARKVTLEAVVTRFHALTKRTRYSIGGEHEVWMMLTVRDAETGEVIEPARLVGFDTRVSPEEAFSNEEHGIYQREEINAMVRDLIGKELS